MKIKSRLFEIMQLCSLHSVLLFLYISVLLKRNFLKKKMKEYLVFSCTVTYVKRWFGKKQLATPSATC